MDKKIFIYSFIFLIISLELRGIEPVSPLKIELPPKPDLSGIIDIAERIETAKEVKPGMIGEKDDYWGEKKSEYYAKLEIDEKNGVRYIEPLTSEQLKNRKYYEHVYFGKMLTEIDYRDEKGNLQNDEINEAAIIKQKYDKNGNLVEETTYNPDGTLKKDWYGFAIYRWEYDTQKTRIKGAFYDENGMLTKKRFSETAINTWTYDDKGNMVIWANYNPNGELAKDILGVAVTKYRYDDKKRLILTATYGTDRKLLNNKYGYAVTSKNYSDEEKSVLIARYDHEMKPVKIEHGYYNLQISNDDGKWNESAFYDADGNLQENQEGAAIIVNYINETDKSERQAFFNKEKKLIREWEFDAESGKWRQSNSENNN